jgi:hypothetical protein
VGLRGVSQIAGLQGSRDAAQLGPGHSLVFICATTAVAAAATALGMQLCVAAAGTSSGFPWLVPFGRSPHGSEGPIMHHWQPPCHQAVLQHLHHWQPVAPLHVHGCCFATVSMTCCCHTLLSVIAYQQCVKNDEALLHSPPHMSI